MNRLEGKLGGPALDLRIQCTQIYESRATVSDAFDGCQMWDKWIYPLGWPVNLSHRMVIRFIVPHEAKWAWISSAVLP
jgi:hypothetical protein